MNKVAGLVALVALTGFVSQGSGKPGEKVGTNAPMLQAAPMLTAFGEKVTSENCWREYPRPQMVRDNWTCLNGDWDYAITSVTNTPGRPEKWSGKIRVPFAVESVLSGVGRLLEPDEFLWYARTITCEPKEGRRILLHFDGVDYMAMVFIGHDEVTDIPHVGAYEPFTLDITDYVKAGENELTVCVWDPTGTNDGANTNARGKQDLHTHACFYTRCSGIWQSVWMEEVPERHIRGYKITTDIDSSTARFEFDIAGGGDVAVKVEGLSSEQPTIRASDHVVVVKIPDAELWSPENPKLYEFTAKCGEDAVRGYFAMRKIEKRRDAKGILRYFLNNKPVFLYGPLDQGWWPDGLLTPPSDGAMAFDIQAVKDFGFNMMRKHIKVEPRRYYYHCDRLGLMVLQDLPCFNGSSDSPLRPERVFGYAEQRRDLKAMIDNLGNCPCIVEWIPYNEGWSQPGQFLTHSALDFVRRCDPTRLVGGPSGYWDWEGGAETPRNGYVSWDGGEHTNACWSCAHKPTGVCEMGDTVDMHYYRGPGMPEVNDRRISFLGEFGGLGHPVRGHLWTEFDQSAHYRRENPDKVDSWGYGGMSDTGTREGLQRTYLKLAEQVGELATKGLGGAVYTQTTDVEIEINGLMTYDRKVLKFDPAALRQAHRAVLDKVASGSATKVFAATDGRIAPLHQAGQPPNPLGEIAWGEKMFHYLPEAGIRYSRLHDTGGAYGGGKFVDIANLFRDFDADENDPKSYDFVFTDLLLEKMVTNGIAPFFRLGETIENHAHIRRYRTFVPRDMEKWARICEHVIAHYTEGWANGFNYKIDYWEIWNEPDFTSESWNPMWSGTVDDFLMLYETAATHLKRRFPNIKIGGYGSCGFWAITSEEKARREGKDARTAERKAQEEYHVAFFRKLLDRVQAKRIPLDFLTFHSYASVPDMIRQVEWVCEEMERRGLGTVELNLDEWLPEPDGKKLGTAKQAAEIAAVLAGATHTRLGMAMIYDARCGVGAYSPLFNCLTFKPYPAYSVMKFYDTLYRAGCRVPVAEDRVNGFYAAAATDGQGKGWLLLSNIGENPHALPELAEGWKMVGCRTIDANRVDVRIDVPPSIAPGQVLLVEAVRSTPFGSTGVLLLSFDDRNFKDWVTAIPLFEKYGAHATFFVSGEFTPDAVQAARKLVDAGHTVGLHGQHHANVMQIVEERGWAEYCAEELDTVKGQCAAAHIPVRNFAYPNGYRDEITDKLLLTRFDRVRGVTKGVRPYDPNGEKRAELKPLVTDERVFIPVGELSKRRILDCILIGEAYNTDIADIVACIKRAGARKEVLVFASHGIHPDAKHIHMKTEWLETILSTAKECGVSVLGFDEIPLGSRNGQKSL